MTVGNPQTYPKTGDISALNGGVLRHILIKWMEQSGNGKEGRWVTLAVVAGTGVYEAPWLRDAAVQTVKTPYGMVECMAGSLGPAKSRTWFLNRHGPGHRIPPHQVNYRANIWALREIGAERIIATAAVGSLNPSLAPGSIVLPDQFLDFTKSRPGTFFDADSQTVVHTDMTHPFCRQLAARLAAAASEAGLEPVSTGGTYVCTEGPRFETPAEIRAYRLLGGDVVGMTVVPEVVLARELGLCYQTLALVTNWAAGLTAEPMTQAEVLGLVKAKRGVLTEILGLALTHPDLERKQCECGPPPAAI